MEVLSLRVTVNICCQFCSFVFSNQGSQLRNKQTGRGGYLKDKIHSRFIEHKERNDFSSTSTLPPKVLCFKCNQEIFFQKRSFSLCQHNSALSGYSGDHRQALGEPARYILTMGTHFNLNSMSFVPVTEYHCLHSNHMETFLNLWPGSKLVLWGAVFAAPLSVF